MFLAARLSTGEQQHLLRDGMGLMDINVVNKEAVSPPFSSLTTQVMWFECILCSIG